MQKEKNILLFGGTTEGKQIASLLNTIAQPFIYATKTKTKQKIEAEIIIGALEVVDIVNLVNERAIKLIIDATHPFAEILHQNVVEATKITEITCIRFNRDFPELKEGKQLKIFDSFLHLEKELSQSDYQNILALTGVQTIIKLKKVWRNKQCFFRILDNPVSLKIAQETGIDKKYIIPEMPKNSVKRIVELCEKNQAELILSKESGTSGFFEAKVIAAEQLGIPLWLVKQPQIIGFDYQLSSIKELQQVIYRLYKSKLQKPNYLRSGFTTGTCVTACAKAAFISLFSDYNPEQVNIMLPSGEGVDFVCYLEEKTAQSVSYLVIKDAGDDPDITHAEEIGCKISISKQNGLNFKRGTGIGLVTLSGLQISVGEPAINATPRKMLNDLIAHLVDLYEIEQGIEIEPFIPNGVALAKKTFNPRIGIEGGLSILGTSGKIKPYSNEAFLASIEKQLEVAKAMSTKRVVLSSGLRSEKRLYKYEEKVPDYGYIHFGNLVGDSLRLAQKLEFDSIAIALMFGKAIKLAEGHMNTHSKKATFNPQFAADLAQKLKYPQTIVSKISTLKLANAIADYIPVSQSEAFYVELAKYCHSNIKKWLNSEIQVRFYLIFPEMEILIDA